MAGDAHPDAPTQGTMDAVDPGARMRGLGMLLGDRARDAVLAYRLLARLRAGDRRPARGHAA